MKQIQIFLQNEEPKKGKRKLLISVEYKPFIRHFVLLK